MVLTPERNAVVIVSDEKLFPAGAFLAERLAALNDRDDTDIVLFTDSARELETAAVLPDLPYRVRSMVRPPRLASGAMVAPTWFRFFLPEALSDTYRRLLYLDVDVWVEDARPFALFDLDMAGSTVAAVRDACIAYMRDTVEIETVLGKGGDSRYFNAGVLLIDVARAVADDMFGSLVELAGKPLRYSDQTALNMLFRGRWVELSPAFNMMLQTWSSFARRVYEPAIVHFAGGRKPWMGAKFDVPHPARAEMERYFPWSRWKNFLPGFFSLGDLMSPKPQVPPDPADAFTFDRAFPSRPAFLDYLKNTAFADVAAGITTPHLELIPPR